MKLHFYHPYIHKCKYLAVLRRQSETGKSISELKNEMTDWLRKNVNIEGQSGDRFLWSDWTDNITVFDSIERKDVWVARHLYFIDTVDMIAFKLRFGV